MSNLKYITVIDFETSGFPNEGGKPIECAVILVNLETLEYIDACQFYMYLEAGEIMTPEAFEKHGKTPEWLRANGISREAGAVFLMEWLFSHKIITSNKNMGGASRGQLMPMGQNVGFDLKFMEMLIGTERMKVFTHHVMDTMPIASLINRIMIKVRGFKAAPFVDDINGYPSSSLRAQMQFFGFDTLQAHGALFDAKMCLEIWKLHENKFTELILK